MSENSKEVFKISIGQILLLIIVIVLVIVIVNFVKGKVGNSKTNSENIVLAESAKETVEPENKELGEGKILYVTDVDITSDKQFLLSGVVYKDYTITVSEFRRALSQGVINIYGDLYALQNSDEEDVYDVIAEGTDYALYKIKPLSSTMYYLEVQTELTDAWRLTPEEYSIKLPGELQCIDVNGNETTVKDVFTGMEHQEAEETTNPDSNRTFRFIFRNGKCTSVEDVQTSY